MRLVIQRVESAKVLIDDSIENKINNGLVIFLGIKKDDNVSDINYLINKILKLRLFADSNGKMNLSIKDTYKEILLISQFTLYANTKKGSRPSFEDAMEFDEAKKLYNKFIDKLKETDIKFKTGKFGSNMKVSLINDGPVTIIIDSKDNK